MKNLYPQEDWDAGYEDLEFGLPGPNDQVATWMKKFLTPNGGTCFEIGCFPGKYLALCGELGYELSGIDLTPRARVEMKDWLSQRYKVGQLVHDDFFKFQTEKKFDVVYSHGFIEHFQNWKEVLQRHGEFVKEGGTLLITVPNFSGSFQWILHRVFDLENLNKHVLESMNPEQWRALLPDFEIIDLGYFSEFDFWIGVQKRNLIQRAAFYLFRSSIPALKLTLPRNTRTFSPYCGLVARKVRVS